VPPTTCAFVLATASRAGEAGPEVGAARDSQALVAPERDHPAAHHDLRALPRSPATFWAVEEIWVSRMPTTIGLVAKTGAPPVPSCPL